MGRDNYSFVKRQKELAKKKKREEKMQNKLARKNLQAQEAQGDAAQAASDAPAVVE
ncbi:MAG TPA: hypothetical protein PLP56_03020 [Candidatus Omnitrophota bacterium]|nr:hypothetical protein [Candidatus Omnitrophota bacterium]HNQ50382.1 hypothetical protein [Candidatus Omnitrophota bacterium]HQO37722.1 hypothetical protein [Candidatus Omnitrophota bacterium]HQQ05935.1 hypothetical protein [Candidatus Omnitrophota bacterium]